jgi:hypothetical protein
VPSFPPPQPKKRTRPYPQGTVVTGYTQSGILGMPDCKAHGLFILESPPAKADPSNSGFHQDVRCITCGYRYKGLDCEFLMVKGTKAKAEEAIKQIIKARNQLLKARVEYRVLMEEGKIK